jgi:hypothetical protein
MAVRLLLPPLIWLAAFAILLLRLFGVGYIGDWLID